MVMAVAIDTSFLALEFIPELQRRLDREEGDERRFHIHRVSVYATILPHDSEIWRQLHSNLNFAPESDASKSQHGNAVMAKQETLEWLADPDDDLSDAAVLYHLQQHAATVPLLSNIISRSDHDDAPRTLTGSALSAPINDRTLGRPLSSFHRHSCRRSSLALPVPISGVDGFGRETNMAALLPYDEQDPTIHDSFHKISDPSQLIVWADPKKDNHLMFWQVQVDLVDLSSRRCPTSHPQRRRRTSFNHFLPLQVLHSPVVEETSPGNPLPHVKRLNGVRHRTNRNNIWVAEMKPAKHKTKQDFGNFKSEAEAARAVDAAFHHYGRPDLLNFPHSSQRFLSTRPVAPEGLDQKAKVKFVREEAKLLVAAASSPLHFIHTSSLPIQELSASSRRWPSGPFHSFSEVSSPYRCSGPNDVDDVASQAELRMLDDPICDITSWETLNSVQSAEQEGDRAEGSFSVAAPQNKHVNPESQAYIWLDSLIRSPPAPTYSRSPSPSHSQEALALALQEHRASEHGL